MEQKLEPVGKSTPKVLYIAFQEKYNVSKCQKRVAIHHQGLQVTTSRLLLSRRGTLNGTITAVP
jgi:hypothetical protein